MKIESVSLEGKFVRLEPLSMSHHLQLCEVGLDENLWELVPTPITNADEMKNYIKTALEEGKNGVSLPFATIEKSSNKAIGSTRFGNISTCHKRAEIGWTWIASKWQRTYVNTEAKYLMLRHAFEVWKCNRIELKTDVLNEKSRQAILRLGAIEEGISRRHVVCQSGRIRDSVYFSIIDSEWEKVKNNLATKLGFDKI